MLQFARCQPDSCIGKYSSYHLTQIPTCRKHLALSIRSLDHWLCLIFLYRRNELIHSQAVFDTAHRRLCYRTCDRPLNSITVRLKAKEKSLSPVPTLCDTMDRTLPASSVHGIFQARRLEWVAVSFSRGSSRPTDQTRVSHIVGTHFYRLSHQGSQWGYSLLKVSGILPLHHFLQLGTLWDLLRPWLTHTQSQGPRLPSAQACSNLVIAH